MLKTGELQATSVLWALSWDFWIYLRIVKDEYRALVEFYGQGRTKYWRSEGLAPHILNLGTTWMWSTWWRSILIPRKSKHEAGWAQCHRVSWSVCSRCCDTVWQFCLTVNHTLPLSKMWLQCEVWQKLIDWLFLLFVLYSFWYRHCSLLLRSTLCSAAIRRCFVTCNNYTYTHTHHYYILGAWTNNWSYSKSASHVKTREYYWLQCVIRHCSCVWAFPKHLYHVIAVKLPM